jgi:glutamate/tyrosine decarboxylase-like PLP-dependent enzyme
LVPAYFIATIGSTSTLCIDDIPTIRKVCDKYNIWLHVDSAHLGVYKALEEYDHLFEGFALSDSFNLNGHKSMGTGAGISFAWVRHGKYLDFSQYAS